jgi:hypothetical protein
MIAGATKWEKKPPDTETPDADFSGPGVISEIDHPLSWACHEVNGWVPHLVLTCG